MSGAVYEPTQDFCSKILTKMQVTTTWFNHCTGSEIGELVQPNTRVVFLESPASVTMRASSLVFDTVADKQRATAGRAEGELFYGRRGTLTHFSLQDAMSELEGGAGCALYPCGAAAVANAILVPSPPGWCHSDNR
ncbi:hypothetical protein CRX72_04665 [Pantoea sp. BRM17]|nr:hypothetical protein CRX72_04665 [Pantoea sp. BRM17]